MTQGRASDDADRTRRELARLRVEYSGESTEDDLAATWPEQFARWLADAVAAGLPEPNAMVLATADPSGRTSARTVLVKQYDAAGLVFYTDVGSRKGRDLAANPYATAVFCWLPLHRQIIVGGPVAPVARAEAEAYFATRPRGAQLAAWASDQSTVLSGGEELAARAAAAEARFADAADVPVPPSWIGYRLNPDTVEFWQGRPDRLHDRLRFARAGDDWVVERLSP